MSSYVFSPDEKFLPLVQAIEKGMSYRPNLKTAHRWVTEGIRSKLGPVLKLPSRKIGGRVMTTPEAVADWNLRCNEVPTAEKAKARCGKDAEKLRKMLEAK